MANGSDGEGAGPRLPRPRVSAVSVFRAVVCLEIVGMHTYFVDMVGRMPPAVTSAVSHLRFGYESFFVLAGFFLAHAFRPGEWSYLSVASFFRRRLARLVLPYWAALGFGYVGYKVRTLVTEAYDPLGEAYKLWPLLLGVQDLVPTPSPSIAYWFMAPLLQFYLGWGLVFWAVRSYYLRRGAPDYHDRTLRVMAALVVAAMCGSLACLAIGDSPSWGLARNGVYLCLGCLAYWWGIGRAVRVAAAAGAAGLIGLAIDQEVSRPVAAVVCAALLPWIVRHPLLPGSVVTRGLAFVGERSFSIYLTHTYIAPRVLKLSWPVSGHDSAAAAVGLWVASIVAAVAFGSLFYTLVEKPTARLARRVQFRGEKAGEAVADFGPREPARTGAP